MDPALLVGTVALAVALVFAFALWFLLTTLVAWWRSWIGRALWLLSMSTCALLVPGLLLALFGIDYPGRAEIRAVSAVLVAIAYILLVAEFIRSRLDMFDVKGKS